MTQPRRDPPALPTRPENADEDEGHEVENPGDPGPTVLVPPATDDPREDPKLPPQRNDVPPGV